MFRKKYANSIKLLIQILCLVLHTAVFGIVLFTIYNDVLEAPLLTGGELLIVIYFVFLAVIFKILDALKTGYLNKFNIIVSQIISLCIADVIGYIQISLIHRAFVIVWPIAVMLVIQTAISFIWTYFAALFMQKFFPPKRMILVYSEKKAKELIFKIIDRTDQYLICESVRYRSGEGVYPDNIDEVFSAIDKYEAVLVAQVPSRVRNDVLKYCYEKGIHCYLSPRISDVFIRGAAEIHQFDSPLLYCNNSGLTPEAKILKRVIDVVVSSVLLIILLPLLLIISLAIKIEDGGPVFYRQKRVTENERIFEILKFRSMIVDAEKNGEVIPTTDKDPRITKVGRIIRMLRLDELPQFVNILKGDMTLVGPRPERIEHHEKYKKTVPEFAYRTKVKAGLTGFAQIMGKYNTTPYDKLVLDLIYIENFSFFLDLRLMLLTIKIMFMKESTEGFEERKNDDE